MALGSGLERESIEQAGFVREFSLLREISLDAPLYFQEEIVDRRCFQHVAEAHRVADVRIPDVVEYFSADLPVSLERLAAEADVRALADVSALVIHFRVPDEW